MIDVSSFFTCLIFIIILSVIFIGVLLKLTSSPYPIVSQHALEQQYLDPATSKREPFPNLTDDPTIKLSVIVPSYNEEQRLPPMLDECMEYLQKKQRNEPSFTYEVIVVDDGSTDDTTQVGLKYSGKFTTDKVRVLTLVKNRGKGGAVRIGMLHARGERLLFADADGATTFSGYDKLERDMADLLTKTSLAVIVGSRAHLEEESIAQRSMFRTFLMYGFHFLVWLFAVRTVKDTQCGFKLLTRKAARILFGNMHVERWAFDVELLFLAEKLNIPIKEVAVQWQEIEGSKIVPVLSWLQMGRDLIIIWFKYLIGAWKIRITTNIDSR